MKLPGLLKLRPYFREVIWGGRRLETSFNKPLPPDLRIGESFELSAIPDMESQVAEGPLEGRGIQSLVEEYTPDLLGEAVAGRYGDAFPLLIKLLDAQDDLSIQVHPDDAYVRANNLGQYGKIEAWYVLQSDDGRIAAGLKDGARVEDLEEAIEEGRAEETMAFYPSQPGEVVFVAPGTVHAICRGTIVYEVQQSSNITFRLYDYNRPGPDGKPRELHVDHGLAVTRPDIVAKPTVIDEVRQVTSEHFLLDRHAPYGPVEHPAIGSFSSLTVIAGAAALAAEGAACSLALGETCLIPAGRAYRVTPEGSATYLVSSVPTA